MGTDTQFYKGLGIYQVGTNNIHEFNVYAGQGVDYALPSNGGGKFVVESTGGFTWNTADGSSPNTYKFETFGNLNTLSLGYTPSGDNGASPGALATLASFNTGEPLLVINGFNIAVDWVAANVIGATGNTGNTVFDVDDLVDDNGDSILANAGLYETATLNSAVLYSLAFDNTETQAFEFVLDKYLESRSVDIDSATWSQINTALTGTGVSITYYDYAPSSAVAADAYAVAAADVESDLLLAA